MNQRSFLKEKGMVALLALSALIGGPVTKAAESATTAPVTFKRTEKKVLYDLQDGFLVPERGEGIKAYQERVKQAEAYYSALHKRKVVVASAAELAMASLTSYELKEDYHLLILSYVQRDNRWYIQTHEKCVNTTFYEMLKRVEKEHGSRHKNPKNLIQSTKEHERE